MTGPPALTWSPITKIWSPYLQPNAQRVDLVSAQSQKKVKLSIFSLHYLIHLLNPRQHIVISDVKVIFSLSQLLSPVGRRGISLKNFPAPRSAAGESSTRSGTACCS